SPWYASAFRSDLMNNMGNFRLGQASFGPGSCAPTISLKFPLRRQAHSVIVRVRASRRSSRRVCLCTRGTPMAKAVSYISEGFHTVTPSLIVNGGAKALDFYKTAFGAEEIMRMPGPGGKIMHAEFKIGDSIIMLGDEFPEMNCKAPLPN